MAAASLGPCVSLPWPASLLKLASKDQLHPVVVSLDWCLGGCEVLRHLHLVFICLKSFLLIIRTTRSQWGKNLN